MSKVMYTFENIWKMVHYYGQWVICSLEKMIHIPKYFQIQCKLYFKGVKGRYYCFICFHRICANSEDLVV